MLHSIMIQFGFDPHTVHGAWAIIGTVVLVVILGLVALRFLRPVDARQFKDHELDRLLAAHEKTSIVVDA
jgi:NhaP-type Na+/H+ or K+/H+ antiporter